MQLTKANSSVSPDSLPGPVLSVAVVSSHNQVKPPFSATVLFFLKFKFSFFRRSFFSSSFHFVSFHFKSLAAFAWLKCENGIGMDDCEGFLRKNKILTRGGIHFGVGSEYVRISMLDTDEKFHLFTERLSNIKN